MTSPYDNSICISPAPSHCEEQVTTERAMAVTIVKYMVMLKQTHKHNVSLL